MNEARATVLASIKRQKQAFLHKPEEGVFGDCYRTCIAILLGVDRDCVPHFYATEDGQQSDQAREWLMERGYQLTQFAFQTEPSEVLNVMHVVNPLTPYMLCGFSATGCNHCVIALGDEIVCDPSLTDAGIVGAQDDGFTWACVITPIPGLAVPLQMLEAA